MLAHIGPPDMRIAISYALNRGESAPLDVAPLDLAAVGELNFCEVDLDAYPCLRLARDAAVAGGTAPCTLNAANEVAVHAFLGGRLGFLDIPEVIERTLSDMGAHAVSGFESLYEADREARELAAEVAGALR
jgi:1-deoxy-D-xylulose-5-phosphate reductoisomerase